MFKLESESLDLGFAPDLIFDSVDVEDQLSPISMITTNPLHDLSSAEEGLISTGFGGFVGADLFEEDAAMACPPGDVTGQSLASQMADDKQQVLHQLNSKATANQIGGSNSQFGDSTVLSTGKSSSQDWPKSEPKEDFHFEETSNSKTTTKATLKAEDEGFDSSIEETQSFIDELQDFLDSYERQNVIEGGDQELQQTDEGDEDVLETLLTEAQLQELKDMDSSGCPLANSTLDDAETAAAEDLLDSLLMHQGIVPLPASTHSDSGYMSADNVTEFVTESGDKVIIVVSGEMPKPTQPMAQEVTTMDVDTTSSDVQPEVVEVDDTHSEASSDDSDWLPATPEPRKKPGRKPEVRQITSGRVAKRTSTIKDKRERKKQQNVEAARRYRDKKKSEQVQIETEEAELLSKNKKLKAKLGEVESEVKTLKKLMMDLGLLKQIVKR